MEFGVKSDNGVIGLVVKKVDTFGNIHRRKFLINPEISGMCNGRVTTQYIYYSQTTSGASSIFVNVYFDKGDESFIKDTKKM